jgi:hypothetical protein
MTTPQSPRPSPLRRARLLTAATILTATLATGAVTVHLATSVDASAEAPTSVTNHGSDKGSFGHVNPPGSSNSSPDTSTSGS